MRVAVIGAGKMGLPLACTFASRGAEVIACDVNPAVVAALNQGKSTIDEPGIAELLAHLVEKKCLRATTDVVAGVGAADVVVVIVPVLLTLDQRADLSIITAVTEQIATGLRPGMLVSYETTLPIGGTRNLAAILEKSKLRAGKDFDLAFSPERVKSQFVLQRLAETSKVVGGATPRSAERAAAFYAKYLGAPVINVGTLEAAELVKLAGMIYRDVNIALSNELALYAMHVGVDLEPVFHAANTDGEASLLVPGIGVGGHCTPVYPWFLIRDAQDRGLPLPLISLGRTVNDRQPASVLDILENSWSAVAGKRATILGLGFRPQVKEHTCSPAFALRDELRRRGARVFLHDPLYRPEEICRHGFEAGSLENPSELFILNTAHVCYRVLDFAALAQLGVRAVVDGRNAWDPAAVRAAGLFYLGIGRSERAA